jgi:hypothetical protein
LGYSFHNNPGSLAIFAYDPRASSRAFVARQLCDIHRNAPLLACNAALHHAQKSMVKFAVFTQAEKEIVGKVSKLIFGAAIAAASIATPALAAHKGKPISTYQNRYVPQSQGSGVHNCVPTPSCPGLPYCDPCSGISYPGGEPGH